MNNTRSILLFAASVGLVAQVNSATLTLQQGVNNYAGCTDTYIVMTTDSTPDNATTMVVEGYHCSACIDERGFIRFDLSSLDKNMAITKAELQMYCTTQPRPGAGTIRAYKVNKQWVPAEVNWYNAAKSVPWTTAGGDYNATAVGTVNYPNSTRVWHTIDVTQAIKGYLAEPTTNTGFMLKMDPMMLTVTYASAQAADPTLRPKLVITYTGAAVTNFSARGTHSPRSMPSWKISGSNMHIVFPTSGMHDVTLQRLNGTTIAKGRFSGQSFDFDLAGIATGPFTMLTTGDQGTFRQAITYNRK